MILPLRLCWISLCQCHSPLISVGSMELIRAILSHIVSQTPLFWGPYHSISPHHPFTFSPKVTLCSLTRQNESWGLVICAGSFSSETSCLPAHDSADDSRGLPDLNAIVLHITIRLPSGVSHLKSLSTLFNGLSVTADGDTLANIAAENIKITSSNAPIKILVRDPMTYFLFRSLVCLFWAGPWCGKYPSRNI